MQFESIENDKNIRFPYNFENALDDFIFLYDHRQPLQNDVNDSKI